MSPECGAKDKAKNENKGAHIKITREPEELRPTDNTRVELRQLLKWERRSEERDWVIGCPFRRLA